MKSLIHIEITRIQNTRIHRVTVTRDIQFESSENEFKFRIYQMISIIKGFRLLRISQRHGHDSRTVERFLVAVGVEDTRDIVRLDLPR
jgi:hypothetical protein